MIVSCVLNDMGYENSSKCGLINDLRCVIGRFMGRDEPGYNASTGLIRCRAAAGANGCRLMGAPSKFACTARGPPTLKCIPTWHGA